MSFSGEKGLVVHGRRGFHHLAKKIIWQNRGKNRPTVLRHWEEEGKNMNGTLFGKKRGRRGKDGSPREREREKIKRLTMSFCRVSFAPCLVGMMISSRG